MFLRKKETSNKRKIIPSSDDEEELDSPIKKKIAVSTSKSSAPKPRPSTGKKKYLADEDYDMASPQHSSASEDENDDPFIDDDDIKPQKSKSKTSTKKPPVASSSKTKISTSNSANGTTKSQDAPKPNKFECVSFFSPDLYMSLCLSSWAAKKAAQLAGPVAHGSKEVPNGAPDCLAGLSFVFTGELSSFSREEASDVAKRFGGFVQRVTCLARSY